MKIIKLLVCLGAVWLVPNLLAQQSTGSIRSTVTDPSGGAVLEDACVTARQTETGLSRTTTTDHADAEVIQAAGTNLASSFPNVKCSISPLTVATSDFNRALLEESLPCPPKLRS
jgi:hypothetical protein